MQLTCVSMYSPLAQGGEILLGKHFFPALRMCAGHDELTIIGTEVWKSILNVGTIAPFFKLICFHKNLVFLPAMKTNVINLRSRKTFIERVNVNCHDVGPPNPPII